MSKHTSTTARAIDLAVRGPVLAAMIAAAMTTGTLAQDDHKPAPAFCVINSVSILQPCPSTVGAHIKSNDGYMSIHMDNQKIGSAVAQYWAAQAAIGASMVASSSPDLQTGLSSE